MPAAEIIAVSVRNYTKPVRAPDDIHFLTVAEQKQFLNAAKHSHNYAQYALILETGLRTGEMIGLTWNAIDWEKHTLTVNKTLEYRHKQGVWRAGPPKTESSYRTIPLTDTANRRFHEKGRSAVRKGTGSTKRVSKSDLSTQRQIQFSQKTTYIRTI